jgi:spore coat protein YutH
VLERELYEKYRIYPDAIFHIGSDQIVEAGGEKYLIRPTDERMIKKVPEKNAMAQWLISQGDMDVAIFLPPDNRRHTVYIDGADSLIFQVQKPGDRQYRYRKTEGAGSRLAEFHNKGFGYTPNGKASARETSLTWKQRWERRLDQLEEWYMTKVQDPEKTLFDEDFFLTFPYYLGMSENAIQMMGEIEAAERASYQTPGYNTICHERFSEKSWLTLDEYNESRVKVPSDFTYDHYTRDIAEYLRSTWLDNETSRESAGKKINTFLNEYESVRSLSGTDQKRLFARLMFPIHYFKVIERYYQTLNDKEKIVMEQKALHIFNNSKEYEQLLALLVRRYRSLRRSGLPEWIV